MTISNDALCRVALDAADRGWHVFPLRHNDKRLAFPDHAAERCDGRDPRCRTLGAAATTTTDSATRAYHGDRRLSFPG